VRSVDLLAQFTFSILSLLFAGAKSKRLERNERLKPAPQTQILSRSPARPRQPLSLPMSALLHAAPRAYGPSTRRVHDISTPHISQGPPPPPDVDAGLEFSPVGHFKPGKDL